ncbi:MAG: hypothetical protein L0I84_08200 [Halomonas subglaciescola]|nr:hypothetical protein [Halomonas subglaciescola]
MHCVFAVIRDDGRPGEEKRAAPGSGRRDGERLVALTRLGGKAVDAEHPVSEEGFQAVISGKAKV